MKTLLKYFFGLVAVFYLVDIIFGQPLNHFFNWLAPAIGLGAFYFISKRG